MHCAVCKIIWYFSLVRRQPQSTHSWLPELVQHRRWWLCMHMIPPSFTCLPRCAAQGDPGSATIHEHVALKINIHDPEANSRNSPSGQFQLFQYSTGNGFVSARSRRHLGSYAVLDHMQSMDVWIHAIFLSTLQPFFLQIYKKWFHTLVFNRSGNSGCWQCAFVSFGAKIGVSWQMGRTAIVCKFVAVSCGRHSFDSKFESDYIWYSSGTCWRVVGYASLWDYSMGGIMVCSWMQW